MTRYALSFCQPKRGWNRSETELTFSNNRNEPLAGCSGMSASPFIRLALIHRPQPALKECFCKGERTCRRIRRQKEVKPTGVLLEPSSDRADFKNLDVGGTGHEDPHAAAVLDDGLRQSTSSMCAVVLTGEPRLRLWACLANLQAPVAEEKAVHGLASGW